LSFGLLVLKKLRMKAITRTQYGLPKEVLKIREIDVPIPKEKELLIRVHATTINRTDCAILTGRPFIMRAFTGLVKPSDLVPGTDFAGEVTAIGNQVSNFKIGDRVFGFYDEGLSSQAEFMTIEADSAVIHIPENIDYKTAVASCEGVHYAYNFVNKVKINSGDKILVNGATGAIGSASVQLLQHLGAKVSAVGNTKNLEMLKLMGVEKVINYESEDFTEDDERYHFVCDAVGKSTFAKCKHLLLPKGVYLSSELGPYAQNIYLPLFTKLLGKKKVVFPIPSDCKKSVLSISKLLAEGKFEPLIDRSYALDQAADAYTYVMTGQKTGNVILALS